MGYSINENLIFNLNRSLFDDEMSRIDDSVESSLYSVVSDSWYAVSLSGFNQPGHGKDLGIYEFLNPIQTVDLGDGITRYKVYIKIIGSAFNPNASSPTDMLTDVFGQMKEDERAYAVDAMYTEAYTESRNQIPHYGSYLLVEEVGTRYFIKKIITKNLKEFKMSKSKESTKKSFNDGTKTPGYLPIKNDIKKPEGWTKAQIPISSKHYHTSLYRWRSIKRHYHPGIDIGGVPAGTPIQTIFDGVVVFMGYHGGFGNTVEIFHEDQNVISTYHHMFKPSPLKLGQFVRQGDLVGGVGTTGSSTGNHLHFELWIPHSGGKLSLDGIDDKKTWKSTYFSKKGKGVHGKFICSKTGIYCPVNPLPSKWGPQKSKGLKSWNEPDNPGHEITGWTIVPRKGRANGTLGYATE